MDWFLKTCFQMQPKNGTSFLKLRRDLGISE